MIDDIESCHFQYADKDKQKCVINLNYSSTLETPISLVIDTRIVIHNSEIFIEPIPNNNAKLIINNQDVLEIFYEDYIFMFNSNNGNIRAENNEELTEMFDYNDISQLHKLLFHAGAYEVSDFQINTNNNTVTYIKDNKVIQIINNGNEDIKEPLYSDGWIEVDDQVYCYAPLSKYIILRNIDTDNLKVFIY